MKPDALTTLALLGSARIKEFPSTPAPELRDLWPGPAPEDPAEALLRALAMSRALHLAGMKPARLEEGPSAPCPPESRPYLPAHLLAAGGRLLEGEYPELLGEWLRLAEASGTICPPRLLITLLPLGTREPAHRDAVRSLAGERGRWLARRHPEFSWLLEDAPVDDSAWDDGQPVERLAWLRHMRAHDAARARAAVAAHWAGEDAAMRERIVRLIAESPRAEDEDFLEREAFRDRRQDVREPALAALLRIPGSGLLARALERIRPLVRVERRLLRKHLLVEPPQTYERAWAADGIKEKPPAGVGEKAWWLRQITGMAPLADWTDLTGLSLPDLLALPVSEDWADALRLGWMDAAARNPERAGLRDFVPWLASLSPWPKGAVPVHQQLNHLLGDLPAAEAYVLLERIHAASGPEMVLDLMSRCEAAPDRATAPRCLSTLAAAVRTSPSSLTRPQARLLARCVPAREIDAELKALGKLADLTSPAEEFAATLDMRRLLHAPPAPSSPPPTPAP